MLIINLTEVIEREGDRLDAKVPDKLIKGRERTINPQNRAVGKIFIFCRLENEGDPTNFALTLNVYEKFLY